MPLTDDLVFEDPKVYFQPEDDEQNMIFRLDAQRDAFGQIINSLAPPIQPI